MIIYLSMFLWVFLMRVVGISGMQPAMLPHGAQYYTVNKWVSMLTMAYIVFWVGMRTGFVDTAAYISGFKKAPSTLSMAWDMLMSDKKGMGWSALLITFKALVSHNYRVWFIFLACVMGFSVSAAYRRHSEAFFFSILLFILTANFTWMMNGLRQCLCATTILLATPWLLKGKMVRYMLLVAALSLVHFSVWIMVPVYFVVRQKPWGKLTLLAILGTSLACYLAVPLAGEVEEALENTSYSGTEIIRKHDDGVHPLRVLVAAVPGVLGWILRRRVAEENNAMLNVGINMSILAALLFTFGVFTSGILMGRLPFYCAIYAPITLPMLVNRFSSSPIRKMLYISALLCYMLFFYLVYAKGMYYISDITGLLPGW